MSAIGWIVMPVIAAVLAALAVMWIYMARRPKAFSASSAWQLDNPIARRFGVVRTLDRMQVRAGMKILDVGCGPGRIAIPAAQRVLPGGETVCLDLQQGMLDRVQRRARQAGLDNGRTVLAEASAFPLPDGEFDLAYLSSVLGEVPDRARALAECYRVLRPGGVLSITETIGDPHYQSRSKVSRLAGEAGFTPLAIHGSWFLYTANFEKRVSQT